MLRPGPAATPTPLPTATTSSTPTSTPIPEPSIESFAAIPSTIEDGDKATLNWSTTAASSVAISGVTGPLPVNGTTGVRPTETTAYTLAATNELGMEVSESVTIAVIYPVVSLDVNGTTILGSIDETSRLSVAANKSDGSVFVVESTQVQWETDDPWVASVSEGTVTAVGPGNVVISATYRGVRAEVPVSVRISERRPGTVRVIYAIPSDREFRDDYSEGISHALVDLQSWYRRQTSGLTFSLYSTVPEVCRMRERDEYYSTGYSWDKVLASLQLCAPVEGGLSDFVWVVYADVSESCEEYREFGLDGLELGRGGPGLAIVARKDLDGLTHPGEFYHCGDGPYPGPLGRWIGGIGHELAHALGAVHPPGCDPWHPEKCDDLETWSLMHRGYVKYPETYLLPADKEILRNSPHLAPTGEPLTGPPAAIGLDPFYEKYLNAGGLPVVASSDVPDAALFRVRDILGELLARSDDLRATIAEQGVRVAIMANSSVLTDLPEFGDLTEFSNGVSWDERTRGGGVGPTHLRPVVAIATENLLCYDNDVFPHEDIFVHEFAHAVLNMGVELRPGGDDFRQRLNQAYSLALNAGLWTDTYASENPDEYWAEGVQSWFGLNDPPGEIHNEINTRAELEAYDPGLAGLIREVFGETEVTASCHETVDHRIQGVVVGPSGKPLRGVGLWAWQGNKRNSAFGETGADGIFDITVPAGSFTLDVYADTEADCSFVGWYDGAGGLAITSELAARLVVDDASVEGIKIQLPVPRGDLAFIAWCAK